MQPNVRHVILIAVAIGGALLIGDRATLAQSTNAFVGTWVLNLDKSSFTPAELAPSRKVIVIEMVGDQMR